MATIKCLLLSGANNHDWRRSSPFCKHVLEESGKFEVTITQNPSAVLEDAYELDGYDLIFSDYNGPEWSDIARKNFESAIAGGKGLVVMHAADNAFPGWVEYEKMVGLLWREGTGHGEFQEIEVKVVDSDHPITRGLSNFRTWDELYHRLVHMPEVPYRVLATAWSNPEKGGTGRDEPVMVITEYGKGRVYHHVLGHVWEGGDMRALENEGFRDALVRGCEWAATGDVT
jgi:type 1 glutamine amidotransferase